MNKKPNRVFTFKKEGVMRIFSVWTRLVLVCLLVLLTAGVSIAGTKMLTFAWDQCDIPEDFKGWQLQVTAVAPPLSWTNEESTWINDPRTTEWSDAVFIDYDGTGEPSYANDYVMTSPESQKVRYWYRLAAQDESGNESAWCYGEDQTGLCTKEIDFEPPPASCKFTVEIKIVPVSE